MLLLPSLTALAFALPAPFPAQDETEDLSLLVAQTMVRKCGECHGSQLDDPDGDFGFNDDLRRLAADEDFVVRGDPEDSVR